MKCLIDKIILFILCMFAFYTCIQNTSSPVITILLTISIACFQSSFTYRNGVIILFFIYYGISLFFHPMLYFLPVVIYELYFLRELNITLLATLCSFVACILIPTKDAPSYIIFSICSCYFATQTQIIIEQKQQLYKLRDSSIENQQLLTDQNKLILSQQNHMITNATLKERNRIAREIHDHVGHMLTRSILQLGALKAINKDEQLAPLLENLLDTLNQCMTNIRSSVHDLHDESIHLKNAIEDLFPVAQRFQINFKYSMSESVPKDIKYCYIAIVKEALTNANKYSNGDEIQIIMLEHPGFYQLLIEDNGTKIAMDTSSGIGIKNMQERVHSMSGTIKISTENGFHIFISIMKEQKQ